MKKVWVLVLMGFAVLTLTAQQLPSQKEYMETKSVAEKEANCKNILSAQRRHKFERNIPSSSQENIILPGAFPVVLYPKNLISLERIFSAPIPHNAPRFTIATQ